MILSAKEKQIVVAIKTLMDQSGVLTMDELEKFGKEYFWSYKLNWNGGIESLQEKCIVFKEEDRYSINPEFNDLARDFQRKYYWVRFLYNQWYEQGEFSKAHSALCKESYGIDLCQTGMMTLKQIEYITKNIVEKDSKCLDMGCGSGYISEFISDACSCYVVGIDLMVNGIRIARKRTRSKMDKINFYRTDMTQYKTEDKYDYIFLFDTIYFISYKDKFLENLQNMLKPKGKILIYYSAWKDKDTLFTPDKTALGSLLETMKFSYEYIDFTQDERKQWETKFHTLLKLKDQFYSEGNDFVYDLRMREAEEFTEFAKNDELFRYLYIINKT